MSNILVLGLGELGSAVVEALTTQKPNDTKITVLLRPATISSPTPEKQAEIAQLKNKDVDILPGDIMNDDTAILSKLFQPYDLVISCLGFSSGPGSQLKIAHAVLSAKVKRFVPWQFGCDYEAMGRGSAQELFDEQLDVRDLLREQTVTEWLIISPGIFTSFLFEPFFGIVDSELGVVRALGSWDTQISVTTPRDIGKLTASIVFDENPRLRNEVVFIAGDTISCARMADVVEEVKNDRKWKREVWTVEKLEDDLRKDPDNTICKYRVIFAKAVGTAWKLEETYNHKKSIDVMDVKGWASENL